MDLPLHPDIVDTSTMTQTHKKHVFHLRRIGLFSALLVAFFVVRLDAGTLPAGASKPQVLAYASEMSHGGLLSGTNAARSANGLAAFALNSLLNNSAQAKAQDMANKDYWAHVSPDGTQPWYFFEQAGYSYIRAGENLAYGFSTSQGAVDGWMNSASHRANILGDYAEVGFGIVNTPNYQSSGEQTIVVAHYGTQQSAPVAPVDPTPAPAQTLPSSQPAAPTPEPTPAAPVETPTETAPVETPAEEAPTAATPATVVPTPVQVGQTSRISVLSMITSKSLPIAALMSLVIVSISIVGYALTHRVAFQHAVHSGEHFVVAHPGLDTGIIAAVTTLILMTTYGHLG